MRKIFPAAIVAAVALSSCNHKKADESKQLTEYSIEQFYKNEQIGGGFWSEDEKKLLVHSNKSGIYNLYEINAADTSRRQLTHSTKESIFAIDYVPGTSDVLYSSDKGGNEIDHIYLLKSDQSVTDLTPEVNGKAMFMSWSLDKQSFFFLSNKRDPQFFDLYKMRISDWKDSLIYQNDSGYDVGGISWDEKRLALQQNVTTSETRLFLLEIGSGKLKEISDTAHKGVYGASGFSKNNQSFFYITDAGKEFAYLVQYFISSGERITQMESEWDVMYSYVSEHEKYRVVALNEDGKNSLQIIDNTTGYPVAFPQIPDGDIMAVSISNSERWMRLTVGSSKTPADIYAYNFDTKELKKLTNTLNPEIKADDLVAAQVIHFKSFDDLQIPAIYYKPLSATEDNKAPALVWVHGGPGGQTRISYFALIQYLVNHGYAILAINNRGSSGYGKTFYKMDDRDHGDKDLMDCIYGKKWLQEQKYIDSSKIGIIGGSYGGFMTMAAMTFHPDEFKVGVDLFGVTNWLRTLKSVPPYWESFRAALYAEMGDPGTADSIRLYNISPLFHADKIKNPVMVLQGSNDPRVLKVESDEIVEAVKKNNVPVEYVVLPDEGHGFVKKENEIKGYGAILAFLDQYLKGTVGQDSTVTNP